MKHLVVPTVNVYVIKGDKVLLGMRINKGWFDGYLCPPGGHVEKGETPLVAMRREIQEELGVDVAAADLEFLCVAARNNTPHEHMAFEFVIRDKEYEFCNAEPEFCSELVWVPLDALSDNIIPDFRAIIERSVIGGEAYLELGYE